MLHPWPRWALLSTLCMPVGCGEDSALRFVSDPAEVTIKTSDIELFWRVFDANRSNLTDRVFVEAYFQGGSPALRAFFERRRRSLSGLGSALRIANVNAYYTSIRDNTLAAGRHVPAIRQASEDLGALYERAVFTDVTFAIGALSTGGTLLNDGQIVVGTELFSRADDSVVDGLSPWTQAVIRRPDYLPAVVIHELIHVQQARYASERGIPFVEGASLLRVALIEGIADFITRVLLDVYINDHLPTYADPSEEALWLEFQQVMNGTDLSGWLFNGGSAGPRPADLGYYIGLKIAEWHYENAPDKRQAIRELIEWDEAGEFLSRSGYATKF